jgi:hypothetical protein
MSQYVAVLRLADHHRAAGLRLLGVCASLTRLPGVGSVDPDWSPPPAKGGPAERAAGSLIVAFDRSKVSLGEIVRVIEDHGVQVRGVAQRRVQTATDPARLATA